MVTIVTISVFWLKIKKGKKVVVQVMKVKIWYFAKFIYYFFINNIEV
jgi:hypothetical protein